MLIDAMKRLGQAMEELQACLAFITMNGSHITSSGFATSSAPDICLTETLTNDPSSMSMPTIFEDTSHATSLPASAAGLLPPAMPDGPTIARSGPVAARVSRGASRGVAKARKTNVIFGPTSADLSAAADPLSCLESRFRARLASIGSTECILTWKASITPAGRPLSRLVPSMRPIVEIGYGLWPTPQHREKGGGEYADPAKALARLNSGHQINLQDTVKAVYETALWPTPTASADKSIRTPQGARAEVLRDRSPDLAAHVMAMWPTPTAPDAKRGDQASRPQDTGIPLSQAVVNTSLWPTPTARDSKSVLASPETYARNSRPLSETVGAALWATPTAVSAIGGQTSHPGERIGELLLRGQAMSGSPERTERPGGLNPAFVSWLMGFPPDWDACAPTAMQSSRRSQRNSLQPTSTLKEKLFRLDGAFAALTVEIGRLRSVTC